MPPPGGKRSGKGLVIGLAVAAVAAAGIVIAVVVAKGGGGGGGGTRDDLVKSALTAIQAGDVDALVKLGDPVALHAKVMDCSEREKDKDADDENDPEMESKRQRRGYEKLVERTKGVKLELISIAEEGEAGEGAKDDKAPKESGHLMKKGDEAGKGCVFKMDARMHGLVVKVRATESGGKSQEQEAKAMVAEIDGGWYLMGPPVLSAPSGDLKEQMSKFRAEMCACTDAACAEKVQEAAKEWGKSKEDAVKTLEKAQRDVIESAEKEMEACAKKVTDAGAETAVVAKMTELKDRACACADRACTDQVTQDMMAWSKDVDQKMKPSAEVMKKLSEIGQEMTACLAKVITPSAAGTPPDDPMPPESGSSDDAKPAAGGSMASIPACADFKRQIDRLDGCRQYPKSGVQSLREAYEQMEKNWESMRSQASSRDAVRTMCQSTADSLRKAIAQICK